MYVCYITKQKEVQGEKQISFWGFQTNAVLLSYYHNIHANRFPYVKVYKIYKIVYKKGYAVGRILFTYYFSLLICSFKTMLIYCESERSQSSAFWRSAVTTSSSMVKQMRVLSGFCVWGCMRVPPLGKVLFLLFYQIV